MYIFSYPKNKGRIFDAQYITKVAKLYFKHENAVQEKHILHLLPFKPQHDKTNTMTCAPSEDSDLAGHPHRMIRAFAVRKKNPCVLGYLLSAQLAKTDQTGRMPMLI